MFRYFRDADGNARRILETEWEAWADFDEIAFSEWWDGLSGQAVWERLENAPSGCFLDETITDGLLCLSLETGEPVTEDAGEADEIDGSALKTDAAPDAGVLDSTASGT